MRGWLQMLWIEAQSIQRKGIIFEWRSKPQNNFAINQTTIGSLPQNSMRLNNTQFVSGTPIIPVEMNSR